jgi:hypothetical protein
LTRGFRDLLEDLSDDPVGAHAFSFGLEIEDQPVAQRRQRRLADVGERDVVAALHQRQDLSLVARPRYNSGVTSRRVVRGRIKNGRVRPSNGARLINGTEVLIVTLPKAPRRRRLRSALEREDVEFVRSCRGRLARQMKAVDGGA